MQILLLYPWSSATTPRHPHFGTENGKSGSGVGSSGLAMVCCEAAVGWESKPPQGQGTAQPAGAGTALCASVLPALMLCKGKKPELFRKALFLGAVFILNAAWGR